MRPNENCVSFRRAALLGLILLTAAIILLVASHSRALSSPRDETLSFGRGLPVQLVDPSGKNSVQFVAYDAPLTAVLQLYALSTPQFISYYNSLPTSYWEEPHLDPTGLPLIVEWQEDVTDSYQWQETPLPRVPSGFYLLTLGGGGITRDELLVVLSRDALLLKTAAAGDETQVVAWASRLSTKEPRSGATITIYDDEGNLRASGTTDADGLYVAEIPNADPQSLIAVSAAGTELTACGTRGEWNSRSRSPWYWPSGPTNNTPAYKVYLYTDRPIYRPGHTVHYKGILRHDDDGDYTPITTTQPITVSVRDARDNVLSTVTRYPSEFGTVSGSFTLADEVGLGAYHLEVAVDGETYRQPFKVEEYRKPDYAVTVSTPESTYVWGDSITVTVSADYYFGQPVAGATVQFALYRRSGYSGYNYPVWETAGTTDEQGRWVTVIDTANYASGDATYTFEATVSDDSNQSVSSDRRVPVYYAEYGLTMHLDKYGYEPGETITVAVQAQDHADAPVVGWPLTVTVLSWTGGESREITNTLGTTDEAGEARAAFHISTTGWYTLRAEGRDGRGRAVTAGRWFWVYHDGRGWDDDPGDELSVSADKESYAPGEVAQLLVRSPVTGTALLSLERGRTRQQHSVFLTDTVTLISLPIEADHAPNVFATVNVFQRGVEPDGGYWYLEQSTPEGRLLLDSAELVVSATDRMLQVELLSDRTTYHPREEVTFTIRVRDQAGDPVAAEVSLGLVDEAIYALSEDLSADIQETFYGRRDNDVASYDSLHPRRFYFSRYPPAPTPPAPTPAPPDEDPGEADGVRRDFPDTAYWHPGVVTDAEGQAVVSLTLPDNLTRWRALARAVSLDTRVGETMTAITVTQDLIVRPSLPRFLIQGDVARLRAIAHNYLSYEVTATTELSATGLVLLGEGCGPTGCHSDVVGPPPVTIPPGGAVTTDWSAVASELGAGSVLARLRTDAGGDAVELPLPIHPFAVPEVTTRAGQVEHEITETVYLSATAIPGATHMEIGLSSSIALGLLDGLEYLISYPFG